MPEDTPSLAEVLTGLGAQIDQVREDVTASADRRTRVLSYLLAVFAFIAFLAIAAAVYAHVRVGGAIGDLRAQADEINTQALASCAFHRDWAELPEAAASAAAAATPGATPTINPFVAGLARNSADAYERKGCVDYTGPLSPSAPTPSPSPPSGG